MRAGGEVDRPRELVHQGAAHTHTHHTCDTQGRQGARINAAPGQTPEPAPPEPRVRLPAALWPLPSAASIFSLDASSSTNVRPDASAP